MSIKLPPKGDGHETVDDGEMERDGEVGEGGSGRGKGKAEEARREE